MTTTILPRRRLVHGGRPDEFLTAGAALRLSEVDTDAGLTRIAGRAVPYHVWAQRAGYHLAIRPGAFDKSIRDHGARIPLLMFHEQASYPVGMAAEWRSEPDGLYGVWRLDDSAAAQRAARAARDGMLTGLSIGWQPIAADWEITPAADFNLFDAATWDRQTLVEGRLAEVSLTPVPNFVDARVSLVAADRHAETRPNLARWRDWRASLS